MTYANNAMNDPLSAIFAALADPTRRAIFDHLMKKSHSVTDVANGSPVSRPAVSQHLKVLENVGLVSVSPKGSHRIYAARKEGLEDLRRYLDGMWDESLSAFAAEITKRNKLR